MKDFLVKVGIGCLAVGVPIGGAFVFYKVFPMASQAVFVIFFVSFVMYAIGETAVAVYKQFKF